MQLILLSGPIAVGKSCAAAHLVSHHQFEKISSGAYLRRRFVGAGNGFDRRALQDLGDDLDDATDCRWLIDDLAWPILTQSKPLGGRWILDAVRKKRQVEHLKDAEVGVVHAHLDASEQFLRKRYERRRAEGDPSYDEATSHPNEASARALIEIADVVVFVEGRSSEDIANIILDRGQR